MIHSTPNDSLSPRESTLDFIKYFAHNYRCWTTAGGVLHEVMLG